MMNDEFEQNVQLTDYDVLR